MPAGIDQRGLADLGERLMVWFKPAGEVQQVVGVNAKRPGGKLAQALTVEEGIRPLQFSFVFISQTVGGGAGHGRLIDHGELHRRTQPKRSSICLALSSSEPAFFGTAVLQAYGKEELEGKDCLDSDAEESHDFLEELSGRSST